MALGSTQPLVKMSTRNIPGGKDGRCVRLTTSPPSRVECHEIWEPKPPGTLWATPGLLRDCFTFTFYILLLSKSEVLKMRFYAVFWSLTFHMNCCFHFVRIFVINLIIICTCLLLFHHLSINCALSVYMHIGALEC